MTPTTGDDGAVRLAQIVRHNHNVASIKGLHHPPLDHNDANRLAQAVLTLTAQLQAANERADKATAEAAVLRRALVQMANAFVTETVFKGGASERSLARDAARVALKSTPLATSLLSELTALREALRPFGAAAEFVSENDASDSLSNDCYLARSAITAGDLRDAAAALTRTETTDV